VHWNLLDEDRFAYTGPEWLLILLDGCTAEHAEGKYTSVVLEIVDCT
jgi:hypothetical protein